MFHAVVLVPVLVASLLACPLKCMGTLQGESAPTAGAASCCHHCDGPANRTDGPLQKPTKQVPVEDCSCPSCVCNGAVMGADRLQLDLGPLGDALVPWAVASATLPELMAPSLERSAVRPGAVSLHPTGRAVRIAHQSFLL